MRVPNILSILGVIAGLALQSAPARAFTGADFTSGAPTAFGACTITRLVDGGAEIADVFIRDSASDIYRSGGSYFFLGAPQLGYSPITETLIGGCLGTAVGNVTNLVQNGADGSFATDTYMGFRFTLAEAAGGLPAGGYHYFVGTSPVPNVAPVISFQNDVDLVNLVFDDHVVFSATDSDGPQPVTLSHARTLGTCDSSLTFGPGSNMHFYSPTSNGQYICARAYDGADYSYLRSANPFNFVTDTTAPTVAITGLPESFSGADPITVTITFSEDVIGFEQGDITISGATITGFSGGPAVYSAQLTPTGAGDVSVLVPAAVATDAATNPNEASNTATATNTLPSETSAQIASFMQARARNLIANQPSFLDVVRGGGNAIAQVSRGQGSFDLATDRSKPLWFRLSGNWSETGTQEDRYTLGVIGTHFQPRDNLWLGAMVQFDDAETRDGVARTDGKGWLIGPYFVAKHASQPLFFEGSLLMGKTDNTASPLGTYEDDFATDRLLATLRVTGEYAMGEATLRPSLGLLHVSDRQAAYVDALSNPIAGQKITQTDLSLGLGFTTPLAVKTGDLTLTGGVQAIWSETSGGVDTDEGGSARVDLGLSYMPSAGTTIKFSSFYGGIGQSDHKAYGIAFDLGVSF